MAQWGEFRVKNATLCLHVLLWLLLLLLLLLLFSIRDLCYHRFHFLFNEVLNFLNRISTNQKPELVIRNCQWDCMYRNNEAEIAKTEK